MTNGSRRRGAPLAWLVVAVVALLAVGATLAERAPRTDLAGSGTEFVGTVIDITSARQLSVSPAATDVRLGVTAGTPVALEVDRTAGLVPGTVISTEVVRTSGGALRAVGPLSVNVPAALIKSDKGANGNGNGNGNGNNGNGNNGNGNNGNNDDKDKDDKCPPGQEHDAKPDKYPPGQTKKGCPRPPSG